MTDLITDTNSAYPKLYNSSNKHIGWIKQIRRGEDYSIALEVFDCTLMEYEILNTHLVECIDFTAPIPNNLYYKCR